MLGLDLLLAPDRLRREPPLEFLELLDDPCWRLRKHHRAQREYRSDLDRDEAVALRPGSVGRATTIRCGHCLGGEASREWRLLLKRDRKSGVLGKRVSVRVVLGGRRILKQKKT